jgi:calcium-dependent protein kinase
VITYLLLSGDTPFGGMDGESMRCVRDNILQCNLEFEPTAVWGQISDSAKNFVTRLLTEDPNRRPTAKEAQQDEWLTIYAQKNAEESKPLSTELIQNLRDFKEYSNLHRILLEVVSFTLRPDQTQSLKADFEKINPEGDGEITLDELKVVLSSNAEAASLGLKSETELEDIFHSLKVQKSASTIRWHEFLAAGLSKHDFDDSNLKLAFDRLDSDRKG